LIRRYGALAWLVRGAGQLPSADLRPGPEVQCISAPHAGRIGSVRGADAVPSAELQANAERFVRSIKDESLNRVIPIGERHLRRAVHEFVEHYHRERNHQGLKNELIGSSQERGSNSPSSASRRAAQLLLPRGVTGPVNPLGPSSGTLRATTCARSQNLRSNTFIADDSPPATGVEDLSTNCRFRLSSGS
jgi:Integrase core domain